LQDQLPLDRRATMVALLSAALTSCRKAGRNSETKRVRLAVTRSSFLFLPVYLAARSLFR
jgi:hypothetical protein